jgi:hypothetical protein
MLRIKISIRKLIIPSYGGAAESSLKFIFERGGLLNSEQNPDMCDASLWVNYGAIAE